MFDLNLFRLDGRVALVTGAARGIGLGIAQGLAAVGAKVAIQDIDIDAARRESDALCAAGASAIALGGDATQLGDAERWLEQTGAELGAVDILVNNASIQEMHSLEDWTVEQADRILRTNVTSPWRLMQLAVPGMRQRKWGRILNIGSIQGFRGGMQMAPYSASKAAIHNMTNAFARALGKDGITVNCIAPGYFNTYRNRESVADGQARNDPLEWIPLRRVGEPIDCAGAAVLLCSDAGAYITGLVMNVDGGLHIS